ncbi:hypothetical protein [uncultured Roseobacter sp.]|uniref:hypothetical protein n=1 Tax=uncultured Roseobacter sp. TaxID=114847 RepID=UPI002629E303|nr:hypothetical protein [uncultured Roseobacter sp.]
MTKQDRTTLKSFFRDGALPTAKEYRDLIDSSVNQVEDGFSKTPGDGLQLNSVGTSLRVMSLYKGLGAPNPSWVMEHGKSEGALHLRPEQGLLPPSGAAPEGSSKKALGMCFTPDGRAGINTDAPDWRLDVDGVAKMDGRIGVSSPDIPHVPADGKWHDITADITGCQAFEVMAGVGGTPRTGRYSMLHAIAMNAFHPRNPILNWLFKRRSIKAQTAVYGSYADRLKLRWVAGEGRHFFKLQIRSNARFGKDTVIRYSLTRLWFDATMSGSRGEGDRDEGLL